MYCTVYSHVDLLWRFSILISHTYSSTELISNSPWRFLVLGFYIDFKPNLVWFLYMREQTHVGKSSLTLNKNKRGDTQPEAALKLFLIMLKSFEPKCYLMLRHFTTNGKDTGVNHQPKLVVFLWTGLASIGRSVSECSEQIWYKHRRWITWCIIIELN